MGVRPFSHCTDSNNLIFNIFCFFYNWLITTYNFSIFDMSLCFSHCLAIFSCLINYFFSSFKSVIKDYFCFKWYDVIFYLFKFAVVILHTYNNFSLTFHYNCLLDCFNLTRCRIVFVFSSCNYLSWS